MEFINSALEFAKAQAAVRPMTEDDIVKYVMNLAAKLRESVTGEGSEETAPVVDGGKSIKETSVTCLECGKKFKMLSKKHIESHGLSVDEYREKYGLKKNTPLVAKGLVRERRKKMQEMKLWERKKQD